MKIDQNAITELLVKVWEYPPLQAESVANRLLELPSDIRAAFDDWMESGVIPTQPVYHEFNPQNIIDTFGMVPPAAFLMLDWLRKDPSEALTMLKATYDRITPDHPASDRLNDNS